MNKDFINLVAEILKIDPSCLKRQSTTESIPQWDSLTHWTVIGKLEEVYNVEFTMDEATELENLGDLYDTLQKKLEK